MRISTKEGDINTDVWVWDWVMKTVSNYRAREVQEIRASLSLMEGKFNLILI